MNDRPHCELPDACRARGPRHCRRCHFRALAKALNADPEFAAARAARMKALHADPEFAVARDARMKALHADPEFAAVRDARMKALNADPEFAAARAARMKALHADPEFAAHLIAARKGVGEIDIPKWVPRDLWVEFLDVAALDGEERAASHIRQLKRGMAACT